MPLRILGVIPARYASSRFPGKSLVKIAGKTMLQHVYERASLSRYLTQVTVATDDSRIYDEAKRFGASVQMTREDHISGTDRVAEVASVDGAQLLVNIQGDEPLIDPAAIDSAVLALLDHPDVPMGTLKKRIEDEAEIHNPNVVKVVTAMDGNAIYFSRHPIPYTRDDSTNPVSSSTRFKHIGLYVYQRDFLLGYSRLPVGPLEKAERLEQLRALENGYSIRVVETDYDSVGVDTPEDFDRISKLFEVTLPSNG